MLLAILAYACLVALVAPFMLIKKRHPWESFLLLGGALLPFIDLATTQGALGISLLSPFVLPLVFVHGAQMQDRGKVVPLVSCWFLLLLGFFISRFNVILDGKLEIQGLFGDIIVWIGLLWVPILYYAGRGGMIHVERFTFYWGVSGLLLAAYSLARALASGGIVGLITVRMGWAAGINPNVLASFLDISVPLTIAMMMSSGGRLRSFLAVSSIIQLLALLLTMTRGSMPGLFFVILYLFWKLRKRPKVLIPGLVMMVVILSLASAALITRITSKTPNDAASNYGRIELYRSSGKLLSEKGYVLGVGFDNFKHVKTEYGFPRWFDPAGGYSSHNAHLEFWLGWGLLGFLGWMGMLISILYRTARASFARHRHAVLAQGYALAVLSFLIHGIFESEIVLASFFFILCAMLGMAMWLTEEIRMPKAKL